MSEDLTSFHAEIADYAAKHGYAPSPEQIEAANHLLNARLTRFSTGLTMIDNDIGDTTPAFAHACQWFTRAPTPPPEPEAAPTPAPPPPPPSRYTGQTAAALTRLGIVEHTKARDEMDALTHAKALASGPNPFRSGGNLTHRAIIARHLPEVAAKLKAST